MAFFFQTQGSTHDFIADGLIQHQILTVDAEASGERPDHEA
jgi:hypothetical protein